MRRRVLIVTALLALAGSVGAIPTQAAEIVWSGLVIAENVGEPSPIPSELRGIEQTLKDLFGYNQFQVIGQSQKTLRTGEEDWLASSKYFALHLHVDAQGESEAGYSVNLKLYKEKELLLETDTKLSKQSPLVIKGPFVGNGQLLLVLIVEGPPAASQHQTHRQPNQFVAAWRRLSRTIRDFLP
jgi:hypothetical protein